MKNLPFSRVIVKAPATTANLGPGFDVFGMAFNHPYDKVTVSSAPSGIKVEVYGRNAAGIPKDPRRNTAGVVAKHILNEFSIKTGVVIQIEKGIPAGYGLGSSAASAAAVAFGLNCMHNLQMSNRELVHFSAKGEVASAGFEHADNVSAAIYGGFIIIKSYNPLEVTCLTPPPNLGVCVAIPKIPATPKKTEKARSVLPKMVPLSKLIHNVGHAASLAVGFAIGDINLIGSSMSDDVVEPSRASMIPGYQTVKRMAIEAGAYGVAVSGAGPSMLAIVDEADNASERVMKAMAEGFRAAGLASEVFYTKPGKGVNLLEVG